MTISLFLRFIGYKYKSIMEYRGAFLISIGGQAIGFLADYVVMWLLVQRFETINGWHFSEIALLISLEVFAYALGATFFYHMTSIDSLIVNGGFDRFLTSPLRPLVHLSAFHFNAGYISYFTVAGAFLVWSLTQLNVSWSIGTALFLAIILISGALIHAAAFIFLGSWSFVFTRSQFLFRLYYAMRDFTTYPISIYGIFIQSLITFALPFAFINYYPSVVLLAKDGDSLFPLWLGWLAPLVGVACFGLSLLMWRYGAKRYQSTGS